MFILLAFSPCLEKIHFPFCWLRDFNYPLQDLQQDQNGILCAHLDITKCIKFVCVEAICCEWRHTWKLNPCTSFLTFPFACQRRKLFTRVTCKTNWRPGQVAIFSRHRRFHSLYWDHVKAVCIIMSQIRKLKSEFFRIDYFLDCLRSCGNSLGIICSPPSLNISMISLSNSECFKHGKNTFWFNDV